VVCAEETSVVVMVVGIQTDDNTPRQIH
jgi:hypothetical protein